jgi:hypothetical protein
LPVIFQLAKVIKSLQVSGHNVLSLLLLSALQKTDPQAFGLFQGIDYFIGTEHSHFFRHITGFAPRGMRSDKLDRKLVGYYV